MALDPNVNTRHFNSYRDAGGGLTRVGIEVEKSVASAGANNSAASSVKVITTSTVVACAGASNLADRKVVMLEARTSRIHWSFDPAFSATDGHALSPHAIVSIPVGDGINVYVRATSGNNDLIISEAS